MATDTRIENGYNGTSVTRIETASLIDPYRLKENIGTLLNLGGSADSSVEGYVLNERRKEQLSDINRCESCVVRMDQRQN